LQQQQANILYQLYYGNIPRYPHWAYIQQGDIITHAQKLERIPDLAWFWKAVQTQL
jgi:hypothetical protein